MGLGGEFCDYCNIVTVKERDLGLVVFHSGVFGEGKEGGFEVDSATVGSGSCTLLVYALVS